MRPTSRTLPPSAADLRFVGEWETRFLGTSECSHLAKVWYGEVDKAFDNSDTAKLSDFCCPHRAAFLKKRADEMMERVNAEQQYRIKEHVETERVRRQDAKIETLCWQITFAAGLLLLWLLTR